MHDRHDPELLLSGVRRLAAACRTADAGTVRALLTADAVAVCDGGVLPVVHGADHITELVLALLGGRLGDELTPESVNGRPGLCLRRSGRAVAVVAVTPAGDRIAALWIVLSPAKLTGWHRA